MPVSKTPLRRPAAGEDESLFDQHPMHGMSLGMDEGPEPEPKEKEQDEDKYNALTQQIADLQRQLQEQARTADVLLTQNTFTEPTFQEEQLLEVPDMNVDLDGYINAKTENALRAERNKRRREEFDNKRTQSLDEKVKALWEDFHISHPDFGDVEQDMIEIAATRVAKRAKARNINMERYMFGASDKFFNDVEKEYIKLFGAPGGDDDGDDETVRAPASRARSRRAVRARDDEDDGRTAGLFGGQVNGSTRTTRRKATEADLGNMIDDIQQEQMKTGFY